MLSFNLIKFPYFAYTINLRLKEGFGGEKKPKDKVKIRWSYKYLYHEEAKTFHSPWVDETTNPM